MNIDWKQVRNEQVPPVAEDDPALALVYAQLRWLDKHSPPSGNATLSGKSYIEIDRELRKHLLDEIERYRWRKAGFEPTREMLDACGSEKMDIHQSLQDVMVQAGYSPDNWQIKDGGVWLYNTVYIGKVGEVLSMTGEQIVAIDEDYLAHRFE